MQYFMSHPNEITDDIEHIKAYLINHYASEDIPIVNDRWLTDQALTIYNLYIILAMNPDGEDYDLIADLYSDLHNGLTDPKLLLQKLKSNLESVLYASNVTIHSVRVNVSYVQGNCRLD